MTTCFRSRADTLEVRPRAQQERLRRTVWNSGGCSSGYLHANRRNSVQWPDFTVRYRHRVNRFDPGDYFLKPEPSEVPADDTSSLKTPTSRRATAGSY